MKLLTKFIYIFVLFFMLMASVDAIEDNKKNLTYLDDKGQDIVLCPYKPVETLFCTHSGSLEHWKKIDYSSCRGTSLDDKDVMENYGYMGLASNGRIIFNYGNNLKSKVEFTSKNTFDSITTEIWDNDEGTALYNFANFGYCPKYVVFNNKGYAAFDKYATYFNKYYTVYQVQFGNTKVFELDDDDNPAFTSWDTVQLNYLNNLLVKLANGDLAACNMNNDELYQHLLNSLKNYSVFVSAMNKHTKLKDSLERFTNNTGYAQLNQNVYDAFSPEKNYCTASEFYTGVSKTRIDELYALAAKNKNIKVTPDPEENEINTCDALLGSPDNVGDVAYYLQQVLNFIRILGPVLIIALSIYDYTKALPSGDKEILSKVNKKTAIRISAGVAIFFAPIIIEALFKLLGLYDGVDCGIR